MSYKNLLNEMYKKGDEGEYMNLRSDPNSITDRIPTISPSINYVLNGGLVPSKFFGFAGPPSCGKSMFAVSCCAEFLRRDPEAVVIWFDAEFSFSQHWLDIYGKDIPNFKERFVIKSVNAGRDIFDDFVKEIVDLIQRGLKVAACVVDSIHSIIPPAEENAESSEKHVIAGLASYLNRALKLIIGPSRRHNVTWLFICQIRDNMDMFTAMSQKYVIPGGKALQHLTDAMLMFEPINRKDSKIFDTRKDINGKEILLGHHVLVKMQTKCRIGPPGRVAKYKFIFTEGIVDTHEEVAELAISIGALTYRGSNYYLGDQKIAAGRAELYEVLKTNPETRSIVEKKIAELAYV